MTSIIVDDEQQSHDGLKLLLAASGYGVEVLDSGYSVAMGLELLKRHRPDLVFLDVEMPDGTGFDLLEKLGTPAFYVVFITAHNKYAETAFRFGALDFLSKPIDPDQLQVTLKRAIERQKEKYTLDQLHIALETLQNLQEKKLPQRIAISTTKELEMVRVEEILFLGAETNYTDFHILSNGKKRKITASVTLGNYEQSLEQYDSFMKVHRSFIVNLLMVEQYIKSEHTVVLRDGSRVPVAKAHKDRLEQRLLEL
jgi:two-component system, LytTR family, response regulator